MGDPDAPPLQAGALLRLLDQHGVRYVLVGGLAATAHGATRVTFDIDLVPEWSDDNLERLAAALRDAEAALRTPGSGDLVEIPIDGRSLRQFEISTWRTRLGDVDVISGTPTAVRGTLAGFELLASRAERREAFGVTLLIADLADLIESKQALGREADLVALPELHRLLRRSHRG
jgi:hypothetical protein